MDAETRKAVEERAYALWEEAGRPEGSALLYWLRAEQELGIIPKVEPDDPLVTLQELAAEAQAAGRRGWTVVNSGLVPFLDSARRMSGERARAASRSRGQLHSTGYEHSAIQALSWSHGSQCSSGSSPRSCRSSICHWSRRRF